MESADAQMGFSKTETVLPTVNQDSLTSTESAHNVLQIAPNVQEMLLLVLPVNKDSP